MFLIYPFMCEGVSRVASKDHQARGKYNLGNPYTAIPIKTVETGRAPCRQQRSPNKRGNTIFQQMGLYTIFDSFLCLSLPTRGTPRLYRIHRLGTRRNPFLQRDCRDAACRVSPAKITKKISRNKREKPNFRQYIFTGTDTGRKANVFAALKVPNIA